MSLSVRLDYIRSIEHGGTVSEKMCDLEGNRIYYDDDDEALYLDQTGLIPIRDEFAEKRVERQRKSYFVSIIKPWLLPEFIGFVAGKRGDGNRPTRYVKKWNNLIIRQYYGRM